MSKRDKVLYGEETKPSKSSNTCPECSFSGDKEYPNGYVKEGNGSFHCPKCGIWSEQ
jgi:transposase